VAKEYLPKRRVDYFVVSFVDAVGAGDDDAGDCGYDYRIDCAVPFAPFLVVVCGSLFLPLMLGPRIT
jgi:hypothetical protein